jgi:hypothetical protein
MKGVTSAMLRERPVARLSAALDGTNPSSSAAVATLSCVRGDTEPLPDKALDAVDFETPASLATSSSVGILSPYCLDANTLASGEGVVVGDPLQAYVVQVFSDAGSFAAVSL